MRDPFSRFPTRACPRLSLVTGAIVVCLLTTSALAGPRWMLVYYRQIGNHVNGGAFSVENHLFREDGTRGSNVGITNQFNPNSAIWGITNVDGYRRIDPDESSYRDVRVYQPGVPTDQTPNFYHFNPNYQYGRYSFETHWLYVSDDSNVTAYPTIPVYHYDLVNGINSSTYVEPPGTESDAFSLTTWTQPIYQTFVVPGNINRIVACKCWALQINQFRAVYSIHQDNGGAIATWPRIGPEKLSRSYHSTEFTPVTTPWALNDVPVTPGQRYALKVRPENNEGFNSYATNNDNYTQGHLYLENTAIPDRDMCAVVVGVRVGAVIPPAISRSPASFARTINVGQTPSDDTFTVSNTGGGTLNYTVSDNAGWLSVDPTGGTAISETDTLTVAYNTATLPAGSYTGTITIAAAGASNSPQTITVNLTIVVPPIISRSPASFTRSVTIGQNPAQDTFTVANSGSGTLNYSVTDDAGWLSVNPPSGTATTETDTLTITYNTAGLNDGPYTGTITIGATGAANSPQTIAVDLTVVSPYAPVDRDLDGDVDQEDFGWFQTCISGPGLAQTDPVCLKARLDGDADVDVDDLIRFRQCLSGPNNPAGPNCAD